MQCFNPRSARLRRDLAVAALDAHSCPASICVGCDIVQADHAPDGEVAQGVIHGVVIRHHGRNQEEVEEELEKEEIERGKEEDRSNTSAHAYDHG